MAEITSVIVGTKFRGQEAIDAIARMQPGDTVRLEREPENKYDLNAVSCHYLGRHVGYIPKLVNPRLAAAMDRGEIERGKYIKVEPKLRITLGEPQQ